MPVFFTYFLAEPQREPLQQLPEVLPRHMSARVNACTTMATSIKEMGYRGELSYHQLLYPNENDVRHVLMWLSKVHSETKSEDNVAVQRPTRKFLLLLCTHLHRGNVS